MPSASQYCVVLTTVPDRAAAEKITDAALNEKLAACVTQVPRVRSSYWWKGKIERSMECLLIIKTRFAIFPELQQCIRENHPYETPEIVALAVSDAHQAYLDWISANTLFTRLPEGARRH